MRSLAWSIVLLLLSGAAFAPAAAADTTPPKAPYFVDVKDVQESSLRIFWGAAWDAGGIASYAVYRDGAAQPLHTQPASAQRAWTDHSVRPGTVYTYVVRATDKAGNLGVPKSVTVTTAGSPYEPPGPPDLAARPRGYMTHLPHQTSGLGEYVELARDGGANAIRDEAWWARIEPSPGVYDWTPSDSIVRLAADRGLRVLLVADTTPTWASGASETDSTWFFYPPTNPADYGAFAGRLAERYGANGTFWAENPTVPKYPLAGIEIWNEQNYEGFWGHRQPDPAHYTAMLRSAYAAIKAVDPSIAVVVGGLASVSAYDDADCDGTPDGGVRDGAINPVRYLEQMYAHGAQGYFDAVGWHPYVYKRGAAMADLLEYDVCSTWSQMAQTPVSARSLMLAHGDGAKKIWATELGIPTCALLGLYPCVSQEQQAELVTSEFALWKSYDWAGGFFVYDLRDDCSSLLNVQCHFGVVTTGNAPKQAYGALKAAWEAE